MNAYEAQSIASNSLTQLNYKLWGDFSVLFQWVCVFDDQSNTCSLGYHKPQNNHHACDSKFEERIIKHQFL